MYAQCAPHGAKVSTFDTVLYEPGHIWAITYSGIVGWITAMAIGPREQVYEITDLTGGCHSVPADGIRRVGVESETPLRGAVA